MNKRILENYNLVNSIIEKTEDKELKVLSAFLGDRIRNIDSYQFDQFKKRIKIFYIMKSQMRFEENKRG